MLHEDDEEESKEIGDDLSPWELVEREKDHDNSVQHYHHHYYYIGIKHIILVYVIVVFAIISGLWIYNLKY